MKFRRKQDVEVAPLKGELLVFNAEAKKFYVMNKTAAFLWDQLDRPVELETLSSLLCGAFQGISPEQALLDVEATVVQMDQLGLLVKEGLVQPSGS